jgi:hypothetical protein
MSGILASVTASILSNALDRMSRPAAWPDPASGFAFRLFEAAQLPQPAAFAEPLRPVDAQLLRRAPDLAAFGYVIDATDLQTQSHWTQGFDRLMGRDLFPSDRNTFMQSPLELLGVAYGVTACAGADDCHRSRLAGTIQRGLAERQFVDPVTQAAAAAVGHLLSGRQDDKSESVDQPLSSLATRDLIFLASLALLIPASAGIDVAAAEHEILLRVIAETVPANDLAEAAGIYVHLRRALDRTVLQPGSDADPAAKIVALCRRFHLFVEKIRLRQRSRVPLTVQDEYDVQDLLHAILKLHFDDVRPEEWTPSYAGKASRADFFLPRERTIIEAKMTRANLGQKEVANELIVDVARYATFPNVDNLVCLVYDPDRRCSNPSALESDLAASGGRLRVAAVVCPTGK